MLSLVSGTDSIADIFSNRNKHLKQQPLLRSEFSIDAAHELARFIYDNVQIPVTTIRPPPPPSTPPQTSPAGKKQTTTSSLNDSKSPDVNVFPDDGTTRSTSNSPTDVATSHIRTTRSGPHNDVAMHVDNTRDDVDHANDYDGDVASNLPHSDFPHTNEIIRDDSLKVAVTSIRTKWKKILLKKASYICPKATRGYNEVCAMYAAAPEASSASSPVSCVSISRDGNS